MTNKENIVSILKTNPELFPYLKEINSDLDLVKELYEEKIDLTKYLNESLSINEFIYILIRDALFEMLKWLKQNKLI